MTPVQDEQRDEVRDRHQPVGDVGERPHRLERDHRADHHRGDPEHAVGQDGARAEAGTRRPSRRSTTSRGSSRRRRSAGRRVRTIGPITPEVGERRLGQRGAGQPLRPLAGVDQHQAGHRAHHDGVPERAGRGDQRLPHRVLASAPRPRRSGALPRPDSLENSPRAMP